MPTSDVSSTAMPRIYSLVSLVSDARRLHWHSPVPNTIAQGWIAAVRSHESFSFDNRVASYVLLLNDEYPSTDEEQSVRLDIPFPDVRTDLNRWMPLVKWFLAIPHYIALLALFSRFFRGNKAIYWAMDLYPDVPVASGMLKESGILTRLLEWRPA